MKNILNLIKLSAEKKEVLDDLESIFKLYEQLQYSLNINHVAEDIFAWLNSEFKIDNMLFALFDINTNNKTVILSKGKKFFMDDDLSHFFIINTHTNLNATVSFCASSVEHSHFLKSNYETINAAFFIISTLVQNAILKKKFNEASSLDSVTNVLTRHSFVKKLSSYLKFSNKKQKEIFLLMISIDRLKAVTDEFNYDISDKVLIELAQVIHENIDEFDLVGRIESDSFLVAILNNQDEEEACKIAKNIICDFAKVKIIVNEKTGQSLQKTVSIGFESLKLDSNKTLNEAIKNADTALYEAKNKGRGEFFKFSKLSTFDNFEFF